MSPTITLPLRSRVVGALRTTSEHRSKSRQTLQKIQTRTQPPARPVQVVRQIFPVLIPPLVDKTQRTRECFVTTSNRREGARQHVRLSGTSPGLLAGLSCSRRRAPPVPRNTCAVSLRN